MEILTLKIPEVIKEKLKSYAKKKGLSKSEIVREALVEYLDKDDIAKKDSFMDLAQDLAGSVEERPDLSSNKKHLDDYGK